MPPDNASLQLKDEALELAEQGEISQAEPLLRAYTERFPYDVEALAWLAVCVSPQEAISLIDRILDLDPEAHYASAWRAYCMRQITTPAPSAEVEPPRPISLADEITPATPLPVPVAADEAPTQPRLVEVEEIVATEDETPTQPRLVEERAEPETVENVAPPANLEENGAIEGEESGPVSLTGLIPDFAPLPDTAVIIPPPPPPAPPQVDPLPILDPSEWLPRATAEARRLSDLPPESTNQIFKLVDFLNKLSWLDPLKTAEGAFVEAADQRENYNRGIELARGWGGNFNKLTEAAQAFQKCRPPLAYAGAAEALVGVSYVNERLYNPLGLVYAIFWADRALGLDPFNIDALVARSEATVRSPWRLLADITVDRLRLLAPNHPRRYAIDGWHEFITGNPVRAAELLRQAVATALTPSEKELCNQMLQIVQPPAPEIPAQV